MSISSMIVKGGGKSSNIEWSEKYEQITVTHDFPVIGVCKGKCWQGSWGSYFAGNFVGLYKNW